MKRLTQISLSCNILFIALLLYLSFNGKRIIGDYFVRNVIDLRHDRMVSMFESCPRSEAAIIFLGNSITEGAHWSELFENQKILNRGIGGDVTLGVLSRIDEIIRHQPSKIFICIGTNDLARRIEIPSIMDNYESIIQSIKEGSPETRIYIQSVLPVGDKVMYGHENSSILELNEEIKKMCVQGDIPYVDLHSHLTNEDGLLRTEFTNDNLHLMGNAYLVWKDLIAKYMKE